MSRQQYIVLRNEKYLGTGSYCRLMFVCNHLSNMWYALFGVISGHLVSAVSLRTFTYRKSHFIFHRQKCKGTLAVLSNYF